jgi:hypothetical protein
VNNSTNMPSRACLAVASALVAVTVLQGCGDSKAQAIPTQAQVDAHAEKTCNDIVEEGVTPIRTAADAALSEECKAHPDPNCENCGANGMQQYTDNLSKVVVAKCLNVIKRGLSDLTHINKLFNQTMPGFLNEMNVSLYKVVADPSAFCEGAGSGATKLFLNNLKSGAVKHASETSYLMTGLFCVAFFVVGGAVLLAWRSRHIAASNLDMAKELVSTEEAGSLGFE